MSTVSINVISSCSELGKGPEYVIFGHPIFHHQVQLLTLARYLICVSEVMQALPSSSPYCTFPRWSTLAMMFSSSYAEKTQRRTGGEKKKNEKEQYVKKNEG